MASECLKASQGTIVISPRIILHTSTKFYTIPLIVMIIIIVIVVALTMVMKPGQLASMYWSMRSCLQGAYACSTVPAAVRGQPKANARCEKPLLFQIQFNERTK